MATNEASNTRKATPKDVALAKDPNARRRAKDLLRTHVAQGILENVVNAMVPVETGEKQGKRLKITNTVNVTFRAKPVGSGRLVLEYGSATDPITVSEDDELELQAGSSALEATLIRMQIVPPSEGGTVTAFFKDDRGNKRAWEQEGDSAWACVRIPASQADADLHPERYKGKFGVSLDRNKENIGVMDPPYLTPPRYP